MIFNLFLWPSVDPVKVSCKQLTVHAPPRHAAPPPYRPAARGHVIFLISAGYGGAAIDLSSHGQGQGKGDTEKTPQNSEQLIFFRYS